MSAAGPRRGCYLTMILPDIHFPHEHKQSLRIVRKTLALLKPKKLLFLGDVLDAARFSKHRKRSRTERVVTSFFDSEVRPARELMDFAEEKGGVKEIVFLEGNHEERVERWITEEGGVWEDVADLVEPKVLLSAGRENFTWVPYVGSGKIQHYKVAKDLIATHGWSCCKHASAKHLQDVGPCSVVHGHTHRKQEATSREPISGKMHRGWCPGTLSELQPIWATPFPTQWVHGFSLVWVRNDGSDWTAYSPTIRNGKCILPDGTKVNGR